MNTLFRTQKKFIDTFETNLFSVLEETVRSFHFVLKDYVINKQLFRQGIDGDGNKLEGYKRTTIRIKIAKGQPVDRTTLLDENKFYPSIHVDAYEDRIEITSDVSYDKYIVKKYGRNILKVSHENMVEFFKRYYLPNLKNKIHDQLTR